MPKKPIISDIDRVRGVGSFRELDPETRAREFGNFRDEVLKGPITAKGVEKWIGNAIDRQRLLAGVVFGVIRWPKSLGRPLTPNLADAFGLEHVRENLNGVVSSQGGSKASVFETMPAPFTYDASTADEYRVAFHFIADRFNTFSHWLREGPWERPTGLRPGYRFLQPDIIVPFINDGTHPHVIEDIHVRYIPLIRFGGIRVLK
jgi:hypothetical protein